MAEFEMQWAEGKFPGWPVRTLKYLLLLFFVIIIVDIEPTQADIMQCHVNYSVFDCHSLQSMFLEVKLLII